MRNAHRRTRTGSHPEPKRTESPRSEITSDELGDFNLRPETNLPPSDIGAFKLRPETALATHDSGEFKLRHLPPSDIGAFKSARVLECAPDDIGELELRAARSRATDDIGEFTWPPVTDLAPHVVRDVVPDDVPGADQRDRDPGEAPACAAFYVALMARHEEHMRREMRVRTERRAAASRVAWTIAIVVAVLFALVTGAAAKPSSDRDSDGDSGAGRGAQIASRDDDRDGSDDDDDDDERDDRGGVAIELEVDGSSGATASGGPATWRTPAIAEVLEAAYGAAGLNRDPTRSWIRRARVAGLIPWVSVKTGWDQSWHDDEPGDVGRSRTFEVRATWRLDRLLFDGRELQMSTIDTARRRERRRLASRVIRAYFVWRKVAKRGGLAPEAAIAELDALTDGWFSERAKSGR